MSFFTVLNVYMDGCRVEERLERMGACSIDIQKEMGMSYRHMHELLCPLLSQGMP